MSRWERGGGQLRLPKAWALVSFYIRGKQSAGTAKWLADELSKDALPQESSAAQEAGREKGREREEKQMSSHEFGDQIISIIRHEKTRELLSKFKGK